MSARHRNTLFRTLSRTAAWATMPVFLLGVGSLVWVERRLGLPTTFSELSLFLGFCGFALVGSLLIARRPHNPVSWIMAGIGLIVGVFPPAENYAAYVMSTRGSPDALAVFGAWANEIYWFQLLGLALIYLPLLFPDGRLLSRRWLPVAVIPGLALVGFAAIGAVREILYGQNVDYQIANPIGIPGMPPAEEHPLFGLLALGFFIGLGGAFASVAVRFRRSQGVARQQLKWFLFAAALAPALFGPTTLLGNFLPPVVDDILFALVLIAMPAAVAVAILRYRLYDIDYLIRRTLAYGALTGALALVYFGSVTLIQSLFAAASGQQSALAIVASTLLIAALFAPLRQRLQALIDRRFYRRKYDAEQVLAAFAATARDEVDMEKLTAALLGVMGETMQPTHVSLWLRPLGESKKRE